MNTTFLIGNGFDLYHGLPTTYASFLRTIEFLKNHYSDSMDTVGKIFGDDRLLQKDKTICESYKKYGCVYDKVPINAEIVSNIIDKSKSNMWIVYLLETFNKDLGWIDFEKEIERVINTFDLVLGNIKDVQKRIDLRKLSFFQDHIIKKFNFFYDNTPAYTVDGFPISSSCNLKAEFKIEEPFGTGHLVLDKTKIIGVLFESLVELSAVLRDYLKCFVENSVEKLRDTYLWQSDLFKKAEKVVTFNYTNTYEVTYGAKNVAHIHGSLDKEIVLGVNPNNYDEIENVDTSFIMFKKYYQRIIFKTDSDYRCFVNDLRNFDMYIDELVVVGHSLDETDKDIIKELFEVSASIKIYAHSSSAMGQHIANLIKIYGKKGFDKLVTDKNLEFALLDKLE